MTAVSESQSILAPQLGENAPWKLRYRLPRIGAQVARSNPDRILVFSNKTGKYEIYGLDFSKGVRALNPITDRPAGTVFGYLSPDGQYVYYLDDSLGNEIGHFVRVPFVASSSSAAPQDLTPGLEKYPTTSCFVDKRGKVFGFTLPNREGFDTYIVSIGAGQPGEPRKVNRSKKLADGPEFSSDGKLGVITSAERLGGLDFSLISFDVASGEKLHELFDKGARMDDFGFSPVEGDYRLLATTNKSGAERPFIWNAKNNRREELDLDSIAGDIVPLAWSTDSQKILLCQIYKASHRLHLYDFETKSVQKLEHPSGTFDSACFRSENEVILRWQNSKTPARLVVLNVSTSELTSILAPEDQVLPPSRQWRSVSFNSSDGQEIQGWLAVPGGKGPFPTIFETHGGPTAAQFEVFSPSSQMWLDHGYAYFTINYRGSTTFGRDFEKKIIGELGHWEVEDMVAGRNWLVQNQVAIPDKIFLTGWSYGGYLTLQAMGVHPELWAGGAGGVVVADWVSQYEDESDSLRGYDIALFGGPPSEKMDLYLRASPLTYVEKLRAPVLIIQGRNDTRDPPRQVELYEKKAMSLGKDVRVEWFDTGHTGTSSDIKLAIRHQEMILRFFYEILKSSKK